jgi:adenylate cyclase
MPEFRVVTGYGRSFNYEITDDVITIGRSKDNHVVLFDHTASRRHAKVRKTPDGYLLMDLDSHNGTLVNGSRVTSRILRHNDLVEIGTSVLSFQYELGDDEPAPHAAVERGAMEPQGSHEVSLKIAIRYDEKPMDPIASIRSQAPREEEELLSEVEAEEKETSQISLLNLAKSNKILYVLYLVTRALLTTTHQDPLLRTILNLAFQVIDSDFGFIVLRDPKDGKVVPKVVKHKREPEKAAGELRLQQTILDKVIHEKLSILTSDLVAGKVHTSMSVPLWRKEEVIGMIQLESHHSSRAFTKPDLDLLTTICNQMAVVLEQANLMEKVRREELMRSRLERFHSPEIVDLIISGESEDEGAMLSPKEKEVTILFVDIVNFTPLSERLSPREVSQVLNQFFREMNDIIFAYRGTLDKYMGDSIMAIFGAPIEREDDADRAIHAALDMRRALLEMNKTMEPDRIFDIRTGINSGRVVAGNLGSPKRMDYTVIGDVVNTASRLEKIAQPNQILIGEATYNAVKGSFHIQKVGKKTVKGKSRAVTVYEVLDDGEGGDGAC